MNRYCKHIVTLLLILLLGVPACTCGGDREVDDNYTAYWINFKDKGINTAQDKSNVLHRLSSDFSNRSLQRRLKAGWIDPVDEKDIPVHQAYIDTIVQIVGRPHRTISRWLNAISIDLMPDEVLMIGDLSIVSSVKEVVRLERIAEIHQDGFPEDPPELPRRDHEFDYGLSLRQVEFINAAELHDRGLLGEGIIIGVTDAGFNNLDHQCFDDLIVLDAWDFVNDDADVGDGDDEGDGSHGTKTLSILAGFDEGNLIGLAPAASYLLAKTENTEEEEIVEEDYWVEGVEWMDRRGVDIISVSLGYKNAYEHAEMDGDHGITTIIADRAAEVGILVVAAMGNRGRADYPHHKMGTPADGDSVLSVGATNRDSTRAAFSSIGPTFDNRIKPDVSTYGVGVRFASPNHDDRYTSGNGTSFSTPAIAGLCALLLETNVNLTPVQLIEALRRSGSLRDDPDTLLGWGVPNGLAAWGDISPDWTSQVIPLTAGWNLISSNLNPGAELIANIFAPLLENGTLIIIKDSQGRVFYPELALFEIESWSPEQGYMVRTSDPDTVTFNGIRSPTNQPIELSAGWQLVAYLPEFGLSAPEAFRSLTTENALIIARDQRGGFYFPEFDFNIMGPLQAGSGYSVNILNDADLVYPRRPGGIVDANNHRDLTYFTLPPPGEQCISVMLLSDGSVLEGTEVAALNSDGRILGAGVFTDGIAGMAVWDASPVEEWRLFAYSPDGELLDAIIKPSEQYGGFNRQSGYAIYEIDLHEIIEPKTNIRLKINVSPNPFNDRVLISYSGQAGNKMTVDIYDIRGRRLFRRIDENRGASSGLIEIDARQWASGVYYISAYNSKSSRRQKIIHIR